MSPEEAYGIYGGRKINILLFYDVILILMSPFQEAFI
jgi:hypothetical protein